MGVDWAVAVFPALLRTKEFPEELPVEGVEDFGAQSFGNQVHFLYLSVIKQFSEGTSTPGTPY